MSNIAQEILSLLKQVELQRESHREDGALNRRVESLKRFQHARFHETYADLLAIDNSAAATRFFLDELYGPKDFAMRDQQFARVIPTVQKLVPAEVMVMLLTLAKLHALSERLDTEMALALTSSQQGDALTAASYGQAWRAVAQAPAREDQVIWLLEVGTALQRHTRSLTLRTSLRLMRGPAAAAGLATLQSFLESGLEAFRQLKDPAAFLQTIATRERAESKRLFNGR